MTCLKRFQHYSSQKSFKVEVGDIAIAATRSRSRSPKDLIYRVSHKKLHLVWRAVAALNFEIGIKVGGVLESSGSQLFKTVPTFDF